LKSGIKSPVKQHFTTGGITGKPADGHNVGMLAECGRVRWQTGNEHNNVLKLNRFVEQKNDKCIREYIRYDPAA
jgi:hypothetical protein